MPIDEIVINAAPGETRAAFVAAGRLRRLAVERGGDLGEVPRLGDVFLGRVSKIARSIDAAFVHLGADQEGFLGLAEARPAGVRGGRIGDFVREGEAVVVQVLREAEGGKAAKLTARPALGGRFLVLLPCETGVRPSQRAARAGPAQQIEAVRARLAGAAGGWLVRAAALSAAPKMIETESCRLLDAWAEVGVRRAAARPPARLRRGAEPAITAVIEHISPALRRIIVDTPEMLAALRRAAPDVADRAELFTGVSPVFAASGIDEQIEALLAPVVALPSGGRITIAETAAVVSIDVDTAAAQGSSREDAAVRTNLEAAEAIGAQILLRELAGHIVIDFAPMRRREHRARVLAALKEALAEQTEQVQIAGYTQLGLVELTRRRRGPSLGQRLTCACPNCSGQGRIRSAETVALEAMRRAIAEDRARPGQVWTIRAAPSVIAALKGPARQALAAAVARLGRSPLLVVDASLAPDGFTITAGCKREEQT